MIGTEALSLIEIQKEYRAKIYKNTSLKELFSVHTTHKLLEGE